MNAAIQCTCKAVVVYDYQQVSAIKCPYCNKPWFSQPEMFDLTGSAAQRLFLDGVMDRDIEGILIQQVAAAVELAIPDATAVTFVFPGKAPQTVEFQP